MSGCPHDIPAMRVSKGNARPTTDVSSGHLMYNTLHNYLEIYHSDSNNPTGWRDLIINNKEQIDISGTVRCDGSLVVLNDIDASGNITAVGDITAFYSSSDNRLKKNIYDISNYEDIIKNVRGVRFNWNEEAKNINSNVDLSKVELGVIAQEVEDYIPEIIKDGIGKYKAVRYEKITPILIECIKDLYTKVEKLEEEVRVLKM